MTVNKDEIQQIAAETQGLLGEWNFYYIAENLESGYEQDVVRQLANLAGRLANSVIASDDAKEEIIRQQEEEIDTWVKAASGYYEELKRVNKQATALRECLEWYGDGSEDGGEKARDQLVKLDRKDTQEPTDARRCSCGKCGTDDDFATWSNECIAAWQEEWQRQWRDRKDTQPEEVKRPATKEICPHGKHDCAVCRPCEKCGKLTCGKHTGEWLCPEHMREKSKARRHLWEDTQGDGGQ